MFRTALQTVLRRGAAAVATLCTVAATAPAAGATYTIFDVSGASSTQPRAINRDGSVTGSYRDGLGGSHGFVRAADGTITTFDEKGRSPETFPLSINSKGEICGHGGRSGFLLTRRGRIKRIDAEGSYDTIPQAINGAGNVVGSYFDSGNANYHGFLRARDGTITTFDPAGSNDTQPWGINRTGAITGYYVDESTRLEKGFIRDASGNITEFEAEAADNTQAFAINNAGSITGFYKASDGGHGFLRGSDGTITSFDPSGSSYTEAFAINANGAITGFYYDGTGRTHGFVRSAKGNITAFDPPNSTSTKPYAINDDGVITGYFHYMGVHGFIRTP